jgi:hypothetical protein
MVLEVLSGAVSSSVGGNEVQPSMLLGLTVYRRANVTFSDLKFQYVNKARALCYRTGDLTIIVLVSCRRCGDVGVAAHDDCTTKERLCWLFRAIRITTQKSINTGHLAKLLRHGGLNVIWRLMQRAFLEKPHLYAPFLRRKASCWACTLLLLRQSERKST